ncbi:MAG TPA: hypothetical protein VF630_03390 [Hymenobacter sp.]|jgi:hypothetical protein
MHTSSPVAIIYQVLHQVQTNAETNANIFRKNEAATRAALIEPVLRALGWDTANVEMVEPEKTLSNELRIDYLLNDSGGKPWIVIEAKCLGSSLDKYGYVGKILGYALTLNVHTVCITDGITWHLHTQLQHGKPEPIVFSLVEDDWLTAANELIRWLDAAQGGHGLLLRQAKAQAPKTSRAASATLTYQAATKNLLLSKPQELASNAEFINLSDVDLQSLQPGQKPKKLRLPNGTLLPITTWKDILLGVCHLVLEANPHLTVPLQDKAGKTRFLFSSAKPEKGSCTKAAYKGKTVFIGTHYSAADCIANAIYASKYIPQQQHSATLAVSF